MPRLRASERARSQCGAESARDGVERVHARRAEVAAGNVRACDTTTTGSRAWTTTTTTGRRRRRAPTNDGGRSTRSGSPRERGPTRLIHAESPQLPASELAALVGARDERNAERIADRFAAIAR